MLHDSSGQLAALLDNLLTWSRAQRGIIEFNPVEFNVQDIVKNTIFLLQVQSAKKNMVINYDEVGNHTIVADINMFTTVLRNLISNAIKFTPDGGNVFIRSKREKQFILSLQ